MLSQRLSSGNNVLGLFQQELKYKVVMSRIKRLKPVLPDYNTRPAYTWEDHERRKAREAYEGNPAKKNAVEFNEAVWEQQENSDRQRPMKYIGAKKKGGPGAAS